MLIKLLENKTFSEYFSDGTERRSTRAETEARKLREECTRQRSVIANLKATIGNLQKQLTDQETKCVFFY